MKPLVRISDLATYLRCPRLVYFDSMGSLHRDLSSSNLLLRELVLSITEPDDLEEQLNRALERLRFDLPAIYGERMDAEQAFEEVKILVPGIVQGYSSVLGRIVPCEADVDLRSERLGLTGRVDRLAPGSTPSIIRTGSAPEEGVWKKDRLQMAGYSLLLGEKLGLMVDSGMVEYPRSGVVREVAIRSVDRGRALRIRDRIRMIKEGQLPDRPQEAGCERCDLRDECGTKMSLLSRFF